jgi:hypothetical protein
MSPMNCIQAGRQAGCRSCMEFGSGSGSHLDLIHHHQPPSDGPTESDPVAANSHSL